MADHFPGTIQIGGPVPRALVPALNEVIAAAGVSLEWGGALFTPETVDHLTGAVDPDTKLLHIYDEQALYGAFADLEEWLVKNSIAFDRQSDARYEFDGLAASFRSGTGEVEHTATQNGDPTVRLAELERIREFLRAALAERSPEKVRGALAALDEVMGPEIPPLEPFVITNGAP